MTLQRPSFGQDLGEIARQEMAAGRIGRRDFAWLMGALGLATAAGGRAAYAATKEITVANFGGDALKAWAEALGRSLHQGERDRRAFRWRGTAAGQYQATGPGQ